MEQVKLASPVTERDHRKGALNAPIQLVEYGEYECPDCGKAYPILKQLEKALGKSFCFVFRNFPVSSIHPRAELAAEFAEAAGDKGKFWQAHDLLFEHQQALELPNLLEYAAQLKLNPTFIEKLLISGKYRNRVRDDFRTGVSSGVNGTPTFYVNGFRYDGAWDFETFKTYLEGQLRKAA